MISKSLQWLLGQNPVAEPVVGSEFEERAERRGLKSWRFSVPTEVSQWHVHWHPSCKLWNTVAQTGFLSCDSRYINFPAGDVGALGINLPDLWAVRAWPGASTDGVLVHSESVVACSVPKAGILRSQ